MLSSRPIQIHTDAPLDILPAKTPRRIQKHGRAENPGVLPTVNAKAKGVLVNTPHHAGQQSSKDYPKSLLATIARPGTRPLGDKTPFPNRNALNFQTPAPKLNKLFEGEDDDWELGANRRVSSTRKHPRLPKSAERNYQTPENQGAAWKLHGGALLLQPEEDAVTDDANMEMEEKDDYDEVEYAPPKLEIPYQPPFDFEMPDYKKLGKTLYEMAFSYHYDDTPPPPIDFSPTPEEMKIVPWEDLQLCSHEDFLDDDPFQQAKPPLSTTTAAAAKPSTKSLASSRSTSNSTHASKPRTGTATNTARATLPRRAPADAVMATTTTPAQPDFPPRPRSAFATTARQPSSSSSAARTRTKSTATKPTTTTTSRPRSRTATILSSSSRPDLSRSRPTTSATFYRAPSRSTTATTTSKKAPTSAAAANNARGTSRSRVASSAAGMAAGKQKDAGDEMGIKFKNIVDLRDQIAGDDFLFSI